MWTLQAFILKELNKKAFNDLNDIDADSAFEEERGI